MLRIVMTTNKIHDTDINRNNIDKRDCMINCLAGIQHLFPVPFYLLRDL